MRATGSRVSAVKALCGVYRPHLSLGKNFFYIFRLLMALSILFQCSPYLVLKPECIPGGRVVLLGVMGRTALNIDTAHDFRVSNLMSILSLFSHRLCKRVNRSLSKLLEATERSILHLSFPVVQAGSVKERRAFGTCSTGQQQPYQR